MSIDTTTRKKLWARSGNRCAICQSHLVEADEKSRQLVITGEECHIVGKEGPRSNLPLPPDGIDGFNNLILLCQRHHKIIDTLEKYYPVEMLREIKRNHEKLVQDSFDFTSQGEDIAVYHNRFIENWEKLCFINNWKGETNEFLHSARNILNNHFLEGISSFIEFVVKVQFPFFGFNDVDNAFKNFINVFTDFERIFTAKSDYHSDDKVIFPKFYRVNNIPPNQRQSLQEMYNHEVNLLRNLIIELTRACNYIIDTIRLHINKFYRKMEGYAIVSNSDTFQSNIYCPRYSEDEIKIPLPYLGIKNFSEICKTRDFYF